jgi:hypothetical protein
MVGLSLHFAFDARCKLRVLDSGEKCFKSNAYDGFEDIRGLKI